jgi:hypothetical protein
MIAATPNEPLTRSETPIGDVAWLVSITGWSHDKVSRLARLKVIKGAFKAEPGKKGSTWNFHKAKTLAWLKSLGS